jgi:hypothetical protein
VPHLSQAWNKMVQGVFCPNRGQFATITALSPSVLNVPLNLAVPHHPGQPAVKTPCDGGLSELKSRRQHRALEVAANLGHVAADGVAPEAAIRHSAGCQRSVRGRHVRVSSAGADALNAKMEDVLEVYHRPHDPDRPVVCVDETSKQLIAETRAGKCRRERMLPLPQEVVDGGLNPRLSGVGCRPDRFYQRWLWRAEGPQTGC